VAAWELRERRWEAEALAAALDASPWPMALLTPHGTIVGAAASFCALVGRSAAELRGLTLDELSHPDDVGAGADAVALCASGGSAVLERRLVRPDGGVVPVLLRVAGAGEAGGAPATLMVQAHELSADQTAK
jgi:PAS domain S-box-containing protein